MSNVSAKSFKKSSPAKDRRATLVSAGGVKIPEQSGIPAQAVFKPIEHPLEFYVPFYINPDVSEKLSADMNCKVITGKASHTHPTAWAAREFLVQQLDKIGKTYVDIGGNPIKNFDKLNCIWSVHPVISRDGAARVSKTRGKSCVCKFIDCKCFDEPEIMISVHTLYYLSKQEILKAILGCKDKEFYCITHLFDKVEGHLNNKEAYYTKHKGAVAMSNGNDLENYRHPSLDWIRTENYFECEGYRVTWKEWRKVGDTKVIKFILMDPSCVMEKSNLSLHKELVLEDSIFKWSVTLGGSSLCLLTADKDLHLLDLPLLNSLKSKYLAFPRTPSTWASMTQEGRKLAQNSELLWSDILEHVKIAYSSTLITETNALLNSVSLKQEEITTYNNALDFKFNDGLWSKLVKTYLSQDKMLSCVVEYFPIFGAILMAGIARAKVGSTLRLAPYSFLTGTIAWVTLATILVYLTQFMAELWRWCLTMVDNSKPEGNSAAKWVRHYSNTGTGQRLKTDEVLTSPTLIQLPGAKSSRFEKPPLPPRKGAIITQVPMPLKPTDIEAPVSAVVGIVPSDAIPQAYKNTPENNEQSILTRVLPLPIEPNIHACHQFLHYMQHDLGVFHLFAGFSSSMEPEPFEKWVSRFPREKQNRYRDAKPTDKLTYQVFTKTELLVRSDLLLHEVKNPRNISMPDPYWAKVIGPYMYTIQTAMKDNMGIESNVAYAGGMTGEMVGQWMEKQLLRFDEPLFLMDDFSGYDQTFGEHFIDCELLLYKRFGLPKGITDMIQKQKVTFGKTRKGCAFTCPGTRKSGDPNTTVGNSLINMLTHLWVLSAGNFDFGKFSMLVMGDDNVIILETARFQHPKITKEMFLKEVERIPQTLAGLGLKSKMQHTHDLAKIEFCSALFYPAIVDGKETIVLGPKPGRFLDKVGHTISTTVKNVEDAREHMRDLTICFKNAQHLPLIDTYFRRIQDLTLDLQKDDALRDKVIEKYEYKIQVAVNKTCTKSKTRSHHFFMTRYGLDLDQCEKQFEEALHNVKEIPAVINYPTFFDKLRSVDNPL